MHVQLLLLTIQVGSCWQYGLRLSHAFPSNKLPTPISPRWSGVSYHAKERHTKAICYASNLHYRWYLKFILGFKRT